MTKEDEKNAKDDVYENVEQAYQEGNEHRPKLDVNPIGHLSVELASRYSIPASVILGSIKPILQHIWLALMIWA